MSMRDRLTEKVGKPHLSYSSLKYALGDMKLGRCTCEANSRKSPTPLRSAPCTT